MLAYVLFTPFVRLIPSIFFFLPFPFPPNRSQLVSISLQFSTLDMKSDEDGSTQDNGERPPAKVKEGKEGKEGTRSSSSTGTGVGGVADHNGVRGGVQDSALLLMSLVSELFI